MSATDEEIAKAARAAAAATVRCEATYQVYLDAVAEKDRTSRELYQLLVNDAPPADPEALS